MSAALMKPRAAVSAAAAVADALLERRRPAVARRLAPRERRVEIAAAALFVATALAMAIAAPQDHDPWTTVLLTVCYALMRRVRFQLGPGLIRPTQLVFVPMLFLTPAAAVPLLVALGSILGELPELAAPARAPGAAAGDRRRRLVLGRAGDRDRRRSPTAPTIDATWGVLLLALAAQIAFDFAASTLREWLGAGIAPSELLPVLALVYLIDASLAPIGYLAVLASEVSRARVPAGDRARRAARADRARAQRPDRARARARARLPALDAGARRARRGPAPPGRPAAADGPPRGRDRRARRRTGRRSSACC